MLKSAVELVCAIGWSGRSANTLCTYPSNDTDISIFPIGKMLVVQDNENLHNQRIIKECNETISCVSVSYSGAYIFTGQNQNPVTRVGTAQILKYKSSEVLYQLSGHGGGVISGAFSLDDKWIATIGYDGKLCIWEVSQGSLACSVKVSPDIEKNGLKFVQWLNTTVDQKKPKYYLICGMEKDLKIATWEFSVKLMSFELTTSTVSAPMGNNNRIYTCGKTNASNITAIGTTTGDILFFEEPAVFKSILQACSNGVLSLEFKNEETLLAGGGDGKLKVIRMDGSKKWKPVSESFIGGGISNITTSPDGVVCVAGTVNSVLVRVVFNQDEVETKSLLFSSHTSSVNCVACPVRYNGIGESTLDVFASCSEDGSIRQWDLNEYVDTHQYSLMNRNLPALPSVCCYYFGSTTLLTGWKDGYIRCLSFGDKQEGTKIAWQIVQAHKSCISCIDVCEEYFVTACVDGFVKVWSHKNRECLLQISEHKKGVCALVIDNTTPAILHTVGLDKYIYTYNVLESEFGSRGKRLVYHTYQEGSGVLCATQRHCGENELIVGTGEGKVLFFDVDYLSSTFTITDESSAPITSIHCSKTNMLIYVSGDGTITLYSVRGDTPVLQAKRGAHTCLINRVCWTDDEKQVITAAKDGSLCVWNVYTFSSADGPR